MADQPALFDAPPRPDVPESEEEKEVRALIDELEADHELTAAERVTARMCLSLAKSIAAGNQKGRSVANDVERLMSTMATLLGTEDDDSLTDDDDITDAEKRLYDALGTPPRHDPAANGYTA